MQRGCAGLSMEDYKAGDEHRCGRLQYSLYGTRDVVHRRENLHRHSAPSCWRDGLRAPSVWQGCIKAEHIVATVHGDDITDWGTRFIKMISRKYETKK